MQRSSLTRHGCGGTFNQSAEATRSALTYASSSPAEQIWSATEPAQINRLCAVLLEYFPALEAAFD